MPQTTISVAEGDLADAMERLCREIHHLEAARKRITKIQCPAKIARVLENAGAIHRRHPTTARAAGSRDIIIEHED